MDEKICWGANALQYLTLAVQPDEVFRWIQMALALLCSAVMLAYRAWKWHKEASADGKIDREEVRKLIEENKDLAKEALERAADLANGLAERSRPEGDDEDEQAE